MPFERFNETARSYKPKVSIRQNGTIAFNSGAVKKFNLSTHKYVTLFFDRESRIIGIRPTETTEDGSHPLHLGRTGASVSATRFLTFFDVLPEKTTRVDARWDSQEKMVVAAL